MKTKKIYSWGVAMATLATVALTSCDKLDELPDNRTAIDSPVKVSQLLTSAYPQASPALLCELSCDNLLDDNVVVPSTHNSAYADFHDEAYQWKDINNYSPGAQDTPYSVWESYYQGISVCNHAIEAMQEMSADPAANSDLSAAWGEAHVLRAYLHFILVNVFAENYKNETLSMNDKGIPYVTKTENVVQVDYSTSEFLHNVKETYDLIEKDLLLGLPLINDGNYKVAAYHMNKNAANAFAARFYLFKHDYEKAIQYANAALGTNPSSMLRKWSSISTNTMDSRLLGYNDETASCNFLIQSTYSVQDRMLSSCRYAFNTGTKVKVNGESYSIPSTLDVVLWGKGPVWSSYLPCYSSMVLVPSAGQQYGGLLFTAYEYFEYTDKIAGIGYVHMLYHPFTAEETLLVRAEAKLWSGDQIGAIEDLNYWTISKGCTEALTQSVINSFYSRASSNDYVNDLHMTEMGFDHELEGADLSILDCILHFRRIETVHEGQRWFDVKRYGITVQHFYRSPMEDDIHLDELKYNDPRRVLQLPRFVIDAGYQPNRTNTPNGSAENSGYQVSKKGDFSVGGFMQK